MPRVSRDKCHVQLSNLLAEVMRESQHVDKNTPEDTTSAEPINISSDNTMTQMQSLFEETNLHITNSKKKIDHNLETLKLEKDAKTLELQQRFTASLVQSSLSDPAKVAELQGRFKQIIVKGTSLPRKAVKSEYDSVIARGVEETAKVNHHADQIAKKMEQLERQHYAESKAAIDKLNALVESIKNSMGV